MDSAVMHHPGELNMPLARTHTELVRYNSADDDTYNTVIETLCERLSHILGNNAGSEGTGQDSDQSGQPKLLSWPNQSGMNVFPDESIIYGGRGISS